MMSILTPSRDIFTYKIKKASRRCTQLICVDVHREVTNRLRIVQKFCEVSGMYTKSLFWNEFERMRFTDTVPTSMKNLEFFMGGNSAETPTRIHWYDAYDRETRESNCETDQERDCVKPDNTTVPYGYAEWKHPMKNGKRKAGLCYCFINGDYKCVKENMKDA
jgi:hypothetical protein